MLHGGLIRLVGLDQGSARLLTPKEPGSAPVPAARPRPAVCRLWLPVSNRHHDETRQAPGPALGGPFPLFRGMS